MHWRHRFPMLFIKLSDTGIGSEDQTQSKPCFSSCNDLEEDLKQQPSAKILPKMFYRIQVWRDSFQTVILQILLNNPRSVRSCIIIHQNEVVTIAAAYGRTYGSGSHPDIQDQLRFLGTHAGQCGHEGRIPNNCVFSTDEWYLRSVDALNHFHCKSGLSVNSTEAHCCCPRNIFLPIVAVPSLSFVEGNAQLVFLHTDLHCEDDFVP
ncbi:hypothetical protein TNCV_1951611 [Trichonephila clavipes]|nr:hypothetical protein TNCV_1951611 [Trichonephila clavipes]